MLLAKEEAARPVDIVLGAPEIVDRNHDPGDQRCQFPSAAVVAQTPDRPQQQRRHGDVKQAEQPNRERQVRIEHVFSAADEVVAGQQSAGKIDAVESLEEKQSAGRPGKNQRALQPQCDSDEEVSDVAEEQKILCPVLPPIKRSPNDEPCSPSDFEPEREAHGWLLYARAVLSVQYSVFSSQWELSHSITRFDLLYLWP